MTITELRKATPQVLKDINGLLPQLLHNPREYKALSFSTLKTIVRDKNTVIVVVQDKKKIIGMGLLFLITKPRGKFAYIEDMIVDISFRGRGLGEKIAKKLITSSRTRGVKYIELSTRPSRVAANALYQKLGFKPKETNVYRLKL